MAGVHRLDQCQTLGRADLTHDQSIGTEPEGGADEVGERDGGDPVGRCWAGLEPDDVRCPTRQLGRVLEHDQSFVVDDRVDHRCEERGLARRSRTAHDDVAAAATICSIERGATGVGEVGEGSYRRREATDRQRGSVHRDRGDHRTHPGSVGQACVDDRCGPIDAPADRREDSFDHLLDGGPGETTA